jgi:hypothetical protein
MDEEEYKDVYHSVNSRRCVFEKASLTRRYQCENHVKINIGEREAAGCSNSDAQKQCHEFLCELRKKSAFVLKMTSISGNTALPHAKELKVQCGGLNGLYKAVNNEEVHASITNIHGLLNMAVNEHQEITNFPWQIIIQSVTEFTGRKRRKR